MARAAVDEPLIVGREQPIAELLHLLDQVTRSGRGQTVLVLGDAGIGKSTVVEAVRRQAQSVDVRVALGWASQDTDPPYWVWRPVLVELGCALPTRRSQQDRDGVFADLVDAIRRAVTTPTLVLLEDLHWADESSLRLLRHVASVTASVPLLLVATARDDPVEVDPQRRALLSTLTTAVTRIELPPLSEVDCRRLAESIVGEALPRAIAGSLQVRTGGNPFFVREVARLLAGRQGSEVSVPAAVREVLTRRLARLSEPCQRILGVAAVAGDDCSTGLLADIDEIDEDDVLDLLDEAGRARLLAPVEAGRVRFVHALVREVRYDELPAARRAALHRSIAETLEREGSEPARLAHHWSRASGEDARGRASQWALVAADDAMVRCSFEQAADWYAAALADPRVDRMTVLLARGEALTAAARLDQARAAFQQVAVEARAHDRPAQLAAAALGVGSGVGGFEVPFLDDAQVALLQEALAALPAGETALRAALLARLSVATANMTGLDQRIAQAREALELAERSGDRRVEVAAIAAYCDAIAGPDHTDDRLAASTRMLELSAALDDLPASLLARRFRVVAQLERGRLDAVDEEIAAYAAAALRLNRPLYSWYVPLWRGMRALVGGDVELAMARADEADAIGGEVGSINAKLLTATLRLAVAYVTGSEQLESNTLDELEALFPALTVNPIGGLAGIAAATGRFDKARDYAHRVVVDGRFIGDVKDSEYLSCLAGLAEAALRTKDAVVAAAAYDALEPYPDVWIVDGIAAATYGATAWTLGRLATLLGRYDEARRWLEHALRVHAAAGAAGLVAATKRALTELDAATGAGDASSAAGPTAAGPDLGELHRDGPVWRVRWAGRDATLRHSKGLADLATLLARPDTEVHVLDLVAPTGETVVQPDVGPAMDPAARAAYRHRLAELDDETDDAERDGDLGRVDRLRAEREFLVRELAGAYGLGGRARVSGDALERARKAVSQRIATALDGLEGAHPGLARHLRVSVTTGRFCAYRPDRPVRWEVTT